MPETDDFTARLDKLGFKPLSVSKVPIGCILNAENAHTYPLINTGGFLNISSGIEIVPSVFKEEWYFLIPPEPDGKYFELEIYNGAHSMEEIINFLEDEYRV